MLYWDNWPVSPAKYSSLYCIILQTTLNAETPYEEQPKVFRIYTVLLCFLSLLSSNQVWNIFNKAILILWLKWHWFLNCYCSNIFIDQPTNLYNLWIFLGLFFSLWITDAMDVLNSGAERYLISFNILLMCLHNILKTLSPAYLRCYGGSL